MFCIRFEMKRLTRLLRGDLGRSLMASKQLDFTRSDATSRGPVSGVCSRIPAAEQLFFLLTRITGEEVKTVLLSLEEVRSSVNVSISISVSQVICVTFKAAEINGK